MDGEFLKTIEAFIGIVIEQAVNTKALAAQLTAILGQLDLGEFMDVGVERFGAMKEALTGIVGKVEFAGEPGEERLYEKYGYPSAALIVSGTAFIFGWLAQRNRKEEKLENKNDH